MTSSYLGQPFTNSSVPVPVKFVDNTPVRLHAMIETFLSTVTLLSFSFHSGSLYFFEDVGREAVPIPFLEVRAFPVVSGDLSPALV